MGNTTLVTKKQWNCSLTSGDPDHRLCNLLDKRSSSPYFTIKGLPNPVFKISACFMDWRLFCTKLNFSKSDSTSTWTEALANITLDVYGTVLASSNGRDQRRVFNLTKKTGILRWSEELTFNFTKFPDSKSAQTLLINVEYIRCKITWHGPILKIPPVDISMNDMTPFFMNQEFSDVKLVVDREELPAHKIVLASQSPVFAAMFSTPMRESLENTVNIPGTSANTVKIILKLLYTGHSSKLDDASVLWEIFSFAKMYEMSQIMSLCERRLMKILTIGQVVSLLDSLDDSSRMLYDGMLKHNFAFGDKLPEYPTEFAELMKEAFTNRSCVMEDLDEDLDVIKIALTYWYSADPKDFLKTAVLWKAFAVVKRLGLVKCRDFCEAKLLDSLDFGNVVEMLDAADEFEAKAVYWRALHIGAERRRDIADRADFTKLCLGKPKVGVEFLEYCMSQKVEEEESDKNAPADSSQKANADSAHVF